MEVNMINEISALVQSIKTDILSTRNKVLEDANKELLFLYFRIGKIISENQKYGNSFINELSTSLKIDFPDATGFSPRNLARMKKFYETYRDISNLPTALAKLPWSFNCLIIDKVINFDARIWYAEQCLRNGWSYILLSHQIETALFERQADNTKKHANFKDVLPAAQGQTMGQVFVSSLPSDKHAKVRWITYSITTAWALWIERNNRIFRGKSMAKERLLAWVEEEATIYLKNFGMTEDQFNDQIQTDPDWDGLLTTIHHTVHLCGPHFSARVLI